MQKITIQITFFPSGALTSEKEVTIQDKKNSEKEVIILEKKNCEKQVTILEKKNSVTAGKITLPPNHSFFQHL